MNSWNGVLDHSPSSLNNFLECPHLTWLDLQAARSLIERPDTRDETAELLAKKGDEHETTYLEHLRAQGQIIAEISDIAGAKAAAQATISAMQSGSDIIYQATFLHDGWHGKADFLVRVEQPSKLGDYSYEASDTKLARRTKPYFLTQLCFYTEQVARLQGTTPEFMHVILGTQERESFRYQDYDAYYRRLRTRYLEFIRDPEEVPYPLPVEHCGLCQWAEHCQKRRETDDHLCLVADIRRDQITRLEAAEITTVAALGQAREETKVPRMVPATFAKLRDQARLQLHQRESGQLRYELLQPEVGRGFALLPEPSPGDIFFDMEGDPFVEEGLEYLFGGAFLEDGQPTFRPWWGHNPAEEKQAFEGFMDFVTERRARFPDLHVYHYAHYEPTVLKRLAGKYGTREEELDDLLRNEVLVDLYMVIRQGMRISQDSYSLKKVEAFYLEGRDAGIKAAGDSILAYEKYLDAGDSALLDEIEEYNKEDCLSTLACRDWLLGLAAEAREQFGDPIEPPEPPASEPSEKTLEELAEAESLKEALTADFPEDPTAVTAEQHSTWLMAQLLNYHRREERPVWWQFFHRCGLSSEELVEDTESIGELAVDKKRPPYPEKRSKVYSFTFPTQELKLGPGAEIHDPATMGGAGELFSIDTVAGRLELKRGPKFSDAPLPRALIPGGPYRTPEQRASLRRLGRSIADGGLLETGPFGACRHLLHRSHPQVFDITPGSPLHGEVVDVEGAWNVVSNLQESYLFIQGPPGSGKTWLGARLIVRLMASGARVGVTSNSHKAIHNLLHEVEKVAKAQGVSFRGLKKATDGNDESEYVSKLEDPFIFNATDKSAATASGLDLIAGTAWLFSRGEMAERVDYLFYDEAGQISLADALAMGQAATNLVFLGDPQQLPPVFQGVHPEGASVSVLEHLLGEHETVTPDRGLFLSRTWRMHPDVCSFISRIAYENRLYSAERCKSQYLDAPGLTGTGLRYFPSLHNGNTQSAPEEAQLIAEQYESLLGGTFVDHDGKTRDLSIKDILVVAPYNIHVRCLIDHLPKDARVGTVDKFQGQEAPVVFFSMASSSGEDIPRNLEFHFSRNRLNVAISRAKAMAVLVASPELLNVKCSTVDQMRMVNALCRFAEVAH